MKFSVTKALFAVLAVIMCFSVFGFADSTNAYAETIPDNLIRSTVLPENADFTLDIQTVDTATRGDVISVFITVNNIKQELNAVEFYLAFDKTKVEGIITETGDAMDALMHTTPMYTAVISGVEVPLSRYEQIVKYDAETGVYKCKFVDLLSYPNAKDGETYTGLVNNGALVIKIDFRVLNTVSLGDQFVFSTVNETVKGTTRDTFTKVYGYANSTTTSTPETVSGNFGNDSTWVLDSEGALTISGTDEMENFASAAETPWSLYKDLIKSVTIEGLTSIGDFAFDGCSNLVFATIPQSVTKIGDNAFNGCSALTSIYFGGANEHWDGIQLGENNEPLQNATVYLGHTHEMSDWVTTVDPTCEHNGLKIKTCSSCSFTQEEILPATGHNYESTVTDPTCTEHGYTTHKCTVCGDEYVDSYVEATDHTLGDWETAVDPTCNTNGLAYKHCESCDYFEEKIIQASGHNYESTVTPPTCTAPGYTTHECTECGTNYTNNYVTPFGHSYNDWVIEKQNTCEEDGFKYRVCSTCNHVEEEITTATGHDYKITVKHPTCTEDGSTTYECKNCGHKYVEDQIGSKGHIEGNWVVIKEANPNEEGLKELRCASCDAALKSEIIPQILDFSSASLTLQDDLVINFKISDALFKNAGYTNPYVVFEWNGVKTIVREYRIVDGKYVFDFINIIPHQMNDTIYATAYATYNGVKHAGKRTEYSVSKYCYNMLEKCSDDKYAELRTLLVDLLNYGSESQKFMNYKTDNLANSKLTDEQKAWGTAENRTLETVQDVEYNKIDNPTVSWKSAGLNLTESIGMRFKIGADSIEGLTVKVTSAVGEWTIDSSKFTNAGNGYYVFVEGMNAGQMSETVYVTVYKDGVAVSNTLRYSIESYAYTKQNSSDPVLADLVKAMMRYGDSAKAYET